MRANGAEVAADNHERLLHFQSLFELAPDAYLVTDRHGNIQEVNYTAAVLLRTSKEFLLKRPLPFLAVQEDRWEIYSRLGELNRKAEYGRQWDVRLNIPREEPIEVAVTVTPETDSGGEITGWRWLLRDISDYKRAERVIRAERAFADTLIETAPIIILIVDSQGRILRSNSHLSTVSGHRPGQSVGKDWSTLLVAEEDRDAARDTFQNLLEGNGKSGSIHTLVTRDGHRKEIAWTGRPLPYGNDGAAIILVGQDVTELREAQRQALQAERLAAIGQMVSGLAHESRNALQRSQSCLELMQWKAAGKPEFLELIKRMQRAQDDLLRLYNGVRAYAAPLTLAYQTCDLRAVWQEAWNDVASVQPPHAVALREDVGGFKLDCAGDYYRLVQVFRNVFENAVAVTPETGHIDIQVNETQISRVPAVRIAIVDQGPGLTTEQREHLFQPFYTTKTHGTGLGLAISKRIVEAHGGQIGASDRSGPGTEIVLVLPRRKP
jgi:two-component system, LuxR family, sensor kinase FixL